MGKITQPPKKIRDYVVEAFDDSDIEGMKRFFLLFGPQGYFVQLNKIESSHKILLVASKHVRTE